MRSTILAFTVVAGLFFASRAVAEAALHVCNATSDPVSVAIAVLEPGTGGTQSRSEGWFQIDAQTCAQVIDTDLNPGTLYYLYAKSAAITWIGNPKKSARDTPFCTDFAGHFSYIDRTQNLCTGAGEQMFWFINEPVTRPDWTVDLDSP